MKLLKLKNKNNTFQFQIISKTTEMMDRKLLFLYKKQ